MSNAPLRLASLAIAASLAGSLLPVPAQAWWGGGVVIGVPPVVVAPPAVAYPPPYYYPPAYYAPPSYYPPPQASYAPPPAPQQSQAQQDTRPFGTTCYAGVYTCAAFQNMRVGDGCSCPGLGAPSYGSVQ